MRRARARGSGGGGGGAAVAAEAGSWPGESTAKAQARRGDSLARGSLGAFDGPAVERKVADVRGRLQDAMWRSAGLVRTATGLVALQRQLDDLAGEAPNAS